MREYIKEYIERVFRPNNLDAVVDYVVNNIGEVSNLENHNKDSLIDELALNFLFGYYNEKYKGDTKKSVHDIPLYEEVNNQVEDNEEEMDVFEIFSGVNANKIAEENRRILKQILDGISEYIEKRRKIMFNYDGSIGKIVLGIYEEMEYDQKGMLNRIIRQVRSGEVANDLIYDKEFDSYFFDYMSRLCQSYPDNIQFKNSFLSVKNYIWNMLVDSYKKIPNSKKIKNDMAYSLATEELLKGRNINDILNGYYDSEIMKLVARDEIARRSIGSGAQVVTGDIKKKKQMTTIFISSALALILWVSNTSVGTRFFEVLGNSLFQEPSKKVTISMIDNYKYPDIEDIKDKDYLETIYNIEDVYHRYRQYNLKPNDRYEQLCLYNAFSSIDNDDIDLMESIFKRVKDDFSRDGKVDFAKQDDYESLEKYDSYIGYVYDMMQLSGIEMDDYNNAVSQYLVLLRSNQDSSMQISPYSNLSDNLKKDLEKMIKRYCKLCRQVEKDMEMSLNKNKGEGR